MHLFDTFNAMNGRLIFFAMAIALAIPVYTGAQPVPAAQPGANDIHQIKLDKPVERIQRLEYRDSAEPLQHELSPDGKSIIIRGYDGTSPVAVTVVYQDGMTKSFYRSRCQIDVYYPEI